MSKAWQPGKLMTQSEASTGHVYDVALVGCGPVGALLANLLGQAGLDVVVLERDREIHALPRAVHFDGEVMRIEHWTNAAEQGVYVGERLIRAARGEPMEPFAPVPFVWSDQYDVKIQCAGRFGGDDRMEVVSGTLESRLSPVTARIFILPAFTCCVIEPRF